MWITKDACFTLKRAFHEIPAGGDIIITHFDDGHGRFYFDWMTPDLHGKIKTMFCMKWSAALDYFIDPADDMEPMNTFLGRGDY